MQNQITAVDRSKDVTVNWTGGDPGTYVLIGGGSTTIPASASFVCYAPASAGTFTIPSYVLEAMPVGSGGISLINQGILKTFTASNLDLTMAVAETESSIDVPFQ